MRRLNALLVLFCMAVQIGGCSGEKRNSQHFHQGARGQLTPEELASVEDAPEPRISPHTRFAAARFFESTRQFDKAVEQYKEAIADDPDFVNAHARLGIVYGLFGEHREAEAALRTAVNLRPDSAVLRNNLAFQLVLQRRWAAAERELRKALELDPGFPNARTNLAIVLSGQGRFDEALAEYKRVLPEADAYYNIGLAYRGQKRHREARAAFHRVLSINPNFEAAHVQLGKLGRYQDQDKSATGDIADVGTARADAGKVEPVAAAFAGERPRRERPDASAEVSPLTQDPVEAPTATASKAEAPSPAGPAARPKCMTGLASQIGFPSCLLNMLGRPTGGPHRADFRTEAAGEDSAVPGFGETAQSDLGA